MNKDNTLFTKSMKKTHTIYMPDMLHYHNELLSAAFSLGGYKLDVVPEYEHFPAEMLSLINPSYCTCAMDIIRNLMALFQQIRPYEKEKGATRRVYDKWIKALSEDVSARRNLFFREKKYQEIINDLPDWGTGAGEKSSFAKRVSRGWPV